MVINYLGKCELMRWQNLQMKLYFFNYPHLKIQIIQSQTDWEGSQATQWMVYWARQARSSHLLPCSWPHIPHCSPCPWLLHELIQLIKISENELSKENWAFAAVAMSWTGLGKGLTRPEITASEGWVMAQKVGEGKAAIREKEEKDL